MIKYLLCLLSAVYTINAYNILVVAPTPNVGQWLYMEQFIKELISRGHTVTGISSYNARKKHEAHTEVLIPAFSREKFYPSKKVYGGGFTGDFDNLLMDFQLGLKYAEHVFRNPRVQEFINDKEKKFDLVIVDHSYQESFYPFARKFNCPLITLSPNGYNYKMDRSMGLLTPLSFVVHHNLPFTPEMSFLQRCYNAFITTYDSFYRKFFYIPAQNKLAKKYFKDSFDGNVPHIIDLEKEIAVMLVNHHRVLDHPRPKINGQVDIGGAHIRKPLNLPPDMNDFMNSAEHGVIIVSFGLYIKFDQMPAEKLNEFIKAFADVKQKIILKIDQEITNLPENIKTMSWLPQPDLLAHPKVVLLITHGEILSVQEATHRGVPMLAIPFFNNQLKNSMLVEKNGYGLVLKFDEVSKSTLIEKINTITENPTFKANAVEASKLFIDNPVPPMEEAMFWIEYVIRNNGAKHLKSSSVNLSWCAYEMHDVTFFYFIIFLVSTLLCLFAIRLLLLRHRSGEEKGKFKYY